MFTIDGKNYTSLTDKDGKAVIPITIDKGGEYTITTTFAGDNDYVASEVVNTIKVKTKINIDINLTQTVNNVVINIQLNRSINETANVKVNDENYTLNIQNGVASLELANLENNDYKVTAALENDVDYISNETSIDFTINVNELQIIAHDLNTSDFSNEEYAITLIDMNNTPISGKDVIFTLNGVTYIVKTDENGIAYMNVNLKAGTYRITTKYEGDNDYFTSTALNTVIVKDKVDINISISKNSNNALINIKLSKSIDESLNVVINNRNYFIKAVNLNPVFSQI